ncbi:hypothetical protein NC651_004919 [Populus alba x Populus x berolinensis]|nr:hypothetical protein NC651_004919 [Populus alba x Populus x berolinensis]
MAVQAQLYPEDLGFCLWVANRIAYLTIMFQSSMLTGLDMQRREVDFMLQLQALVLVAFIL